MSKLQLILLGHFDCLLSSGERISLAMRKAEVLLAYLALAPGIRHPRERLINLLWSDRSEEQARNSLRQCLSAIRKSLGNSADLILQIDRTTVSLKLDLVDVDALEFERLATEADFESLSTAAGLYQGEFLEGVSLRDAAGQEWLDGTRARFKRQYIEILTNLGHTLLASRDYSSAIKSGEHLVEQDPLGESGWRLLMRAYFEHGDRSHALQAFKRCQQALRDELDVDAETATFELRDQIVAGVTNSPPAATPASLDTSIDTRPPTGHSSVEPSPDFQASTDHSIAVLPFDNLSGDPEQEYFSDGITDSIILNLSLFPGLNVKSRNSSFAFKQQIKSLGEISQELEVDYVVEGSIRKSQDRIRITVQLIEAASGNQVWGKRYDAEIENLFDLEEELSRTIAATVTGQIETDLQRIAIDKGAVHPQAYDLLLTGIYHCNKFNRSDMAIAIEKLNQCLAMDTDNLRAHATLCICHMMGWMERWIEDYEPSFKLAAEHAHKALALDPGIGYVQIAYTEYLIFNGDLPKAAIWINKTLQINQNDTDAMAYKALILELQGDFEAALEVAELGYQLDPYHPWIKWDIAESQYLCGHYEQALETITTSGNAPGFIKLYNVAANIKLGRIETAQQALRVFLQECRESMLAMPVSLEEWLRYTMDNAPFADSSINQDLIDCLVQAGLGDENSAQTTPVKSDEHSIAVLPFDNLSQDPEQEYFSDGITESIILNLSLFPGLQVKSRSSSFAFKQQLKSLGEISKELNVDYIVEGSIRKSNDRIRITVQLIEAASGNQIWGKRYDSDLSDLFTLEEELSRTIASTTTGQIESELQRIAISKGASHQKSYDLLLSGSYHIAKFNSADTLTAIEKLNQCLAQDPDNVRAHSMLFSTHAMTWLEQWSKDFANNFELATKHIRKALSLDPENALVQTLYAEYLLYCREYDKAEFHIDKALTINPNDSNALATKSFCLLTRGNFEQALQVAELGCELDPYHPWCEWEVAEAQFFCGRYQDSLNTIANAKSAPGFIRIYNVAANVELGRMEQAREALQEFLRNARHEMAILPASKAEWLQYTINNTPYEDVSINERMIDYLVRAGLEDEFANEVAVKSATDQQPTVLVLPFSNMSGDPEQEYFSDGVTASIILSLGLFHGISVKSQKSSFAFKQSSHSSVEIAEELKADYLVEGSIRKSATKVRVTVQLIESVNGNQIWGKQYDEELEDILDLEQELSQSIAATISGRVGHKIQQLSVRKPAKDMKSYDYLMRGLYHLGKFTAENIVIAREHIQKCIDIDPDNAIAHTNMAVAYDVELLENWASDRILVEKQCSEQFQIALQLDPDDALTHAYLAEHFIFLGDFDKAEFHADRAIELNPTASEGYVAKADLLGYSRRADAAISYADQCLHLDPHSVGAGWVAGDVYRNAGQYRKAIKTFRSISHLPPSIHGLIAVCFVNLELLDEARAEMKLYQKLAKQQMPKYPNNTEEWRQIWGQSAHYLFREDFNAFFNQLLLAGLSDDLAESDADLPSIAVLPFENMSGDPEQEHFSDGITTDIIATLSRFTHLRTVSRYSVLQYKDQHASIPDIANQQNVRYILEGSVRKSGARIRVNAELIDSTGEEILWNERYDRDLDDLFTVQDEITKNIALAMKVQFDDGEMALHRSKGTTNIRAWELTLAATDLADTYIRQNILEARAMAEEAIELDPEYPYAWIALGWSYWQEAYSGGGESIDELIAEAEKANRKAFELDPEYSEVWSQSGLIHLMKHEPEAAIEACRKAVELEPGSAEVQALTAFTYIFNGDYAQGQRHNQNTLKLCPILANWYYLAGAQIEKFAGNLETAARLYRQGIDVEPDSPLCRFYLIDVLLEQGDEVGARKLADEIRTLDSTVKGKGLVHTYVYDKSLRDRFRINLEKFDLY